MMNDNNLKAAILAKVNHDMRERERSLQSIWYAMEGRLLTEQERLYRLGIKVEVEDLLRDVMRMIEENINSGQNR